MGIFQRMSNMMKAKANATLDNIEQPIEMLDQKLRDMDEQYNRAKLSGAKVIGNAKLIEKNLNDAKAQSADYDEKVKLAMSKGNEDLAKKALVRKLEADKKVESLTASYNTANAQSESIKNNLQVLQAEIEKTRELRDSSEARYENAKASKEINTVLADVQTKSNNISLDSIERKISREESSAQGLGEIKDLGNLDDEFAALDEPDLDYELSKYKSE